MQSNDLGDESAQFAVAVAQFPGVVRSHVASDEAFCARFGVTSDATVGFEVGGAQFKRSHLFSAIREAFGATDAASAVQDNGGSTWQVQTGSVSAPAVVVSLGNKRYLLENMWPLHPDSDRRIATFDAVAFKVNLPQAERHEWRQILRSPVADHQVAVLAEAINATPTQVALRIQHEVTRGKSSAESLAPHSRIYLERLVAPCTRTSWTEFLEHDLAPRIAENQNWDEQEGLQANLRLCAHGEVAKFIDLIRISESALGDVFDGLARRGDPLTKLAAVEAGLRLIRDRPSLVLPLKKLMEQLLGEDSAADDSAYGLLSSLVIFVDSQLAMGGEVRELPPFWRRMAAFAQASLIQQKILGNAVDVASFSQWLLHSRAVEFYVQTLLDMRREPRWTADLVVASQLKHEFVGRLFAAAKANEAVIRGTELEEVCFGADNSVEASLVFPHTVMPGPMEGGLPAIKLPDSLAAQVRTALSPGGLGLKDFFPLLNLGLIHSIPEDILEAAASRIDAARPAELF